MNRLDRLTSGLMILALYPDRARRLCAEFVKGRVQKEYIARVKGCFPSYASSLPYHASRADVCQGKWFGAHNRC